MFESQSIRKARIFLMKSCPYCLVGRQTRYFNIYGHRFESYRDSKLPMLIDIQTVRILEYKIKRCS